MLRPKFITGLIVAFLVFQSTGVYAQINFDLINKDKKKEQYEEKVLASEKTEDKKFGFLRKTIQNNVSHYNFYFNANNKLNAVIERARLSNKDDYSKLLSFYPYSLDNTASQQTELDSVIYKSTAGVLLHDLRTNWVDNFYLLIGKSYFLQKKFDSAALTFQFINYNLQPRKKGDDDYNRTIGTNNYEEGSADNGSVSIANKEKRNVVQKAFTLPPSRNDALIWQIRTFTEQTEYGDAAGVISILQNDRNLPKRLQNDLEEVTAYWFYSQNNFDSAATHLEKALSNADSKEDKSRREYLLGQMYEMTGKFDLASTYYGKAAKHTSDPVMDIYAKLNDAKMMRNSGNFKELDNSISNLLRMAKKDRYEAYRDIIYYSAAQLTLQRPDTTIGIGYYGKSINYNTGTSGYRDKSFLQLGNIAYNQRRYIEAHNFYDSITISKKDTGADSAMLSNRKEVLGRLVPLLISIDREDSLQKLAAMSPAEREVFIKKMIKKHQKELGLKETDEFSGNSTITSFDRQTAPDIFKGSSSTTGEWYFYSVKLRTTGFSEFKGKWGKRENVDNWRRRTATEALINKNTGANSDPDIAVTADSKRGTILPKKNATDQYTFDGLMSGIPTSQSALDSSNADIAKNIFDAGQIFQNELEDYRAAISMYENYIKRFPQDAKLADVYFNLSFCWSKLGDMAKSEYYKNLVKTGFAGSNASRLLANPNAFKKDGKSPEITALYADIYNMFIEGNFVQAVNAKTKADSSYGANYWSPQLLYIESVYYIKQHRDSEAIVVLNNIQRLYPASPLKEKAATMVSVLSRRAEIEKYLTDLQVTRAEEDQVIIPTDKPALAVTPEKKPVEIKTITAVVPKKLLGDTIKTPEILVNKSFTLHPEQAQYVVMILDKVDGVYVNEAKNAFTRFNGESMATINVKIVKDVLDKDRALLLFSQFDNASDALKYFDRIKKAAPNEISWLQASKYSFIIISDANLQLLKTNLDLPAYKQLINANFSNRF